MPEYMYIYMYIIGFLFQCMLMFSFFFPAQEQDILEEIRRNNSTKEGSASTSNKRKLPTCKKCHQPKKGHSRQKCE